MKNKYEWKKICACVLAICLSATLLMSHYIPGAFAEETTEEQAEETSTTEDTTKTTENTEEKNTTEESKETTEENTEQKEDTQTTTETKEKAAVKTQQATWKYTSGNVKVSGNGADPKEIKSTTGSNESKYTGSKSVVFDYDISSTDAIDGEVTIDVSDCGIMSDDNSIEIWKIAGDSCQKITSKPEVSEGKVSFTADSIGEYIAVSDVTTVDLAKNSVIVTVDKITGKRQDGKVVSQSFSDETNKKYRVSQSNNSTRINSNIVFNGEFDKNRSIIIDGINTSNIISIKADVETKLVTLQLRGENQVKRIFYGTGIHDHNNETGTNNDQSKLRIENYDTSNGTSGKLYIPYKMNSISEEREYVLTKVATGIGPDWANAGIGGQGGVNNATGMTIAGGTIKVLARNDNGATAIGGGGNGDAQISITGGNITAICSSTGAAIGGGIGWISRGGIADVSITGGKIYAENIDYYTRDNRDYGGVAIGSGSSYDLYGSKADITIGGDSEVTAYARYGNAIGSGNSYQKSAADAKITISGNSIVKTNALGGGTSKSNQGGAADITVSGKAKVDCVKYSEITNKYDTATENILGAFGIGGGNSADTYKGGSANVNVTGGTMNCNGGNIGGGNATGTGDGGDASINVTGGTLDCASIGGGNSQEGTPGAVSSDTQKAGVVVSGGTLKAGTIGGGTNKSNEIGFATADISGGNIQGQFILANTDTSKKCTFQMSGGTIDNTYLGKGNYQKAQKYGGAVYLSDPNGEVDISGGTIQNSEAPLGGAVYMTAGAFKLSGTGTIQDCSAKAETDGSNGYGGAVYLGQGTVTIDGGFIGASGHENKAVKGAGVYQKDGTMEVTAGTISSNEASEDGGGAYLAGGTLNISGGTLESNNATNGAGVYVSDSKVRMFGGEITSNKASKDGGGMYVSSDKQAADVVVRSGKLNNNSAGNGKASGDGGAIAVVSKNKDAEDHVIIGLCEKHPDLKVSDRTFTKFNYQDNKDDNKDHEHAACPEMKSNTAQGNGGGIYMDSSKSVLDIYCIYEKDNEAIEDSAGSSVMASGGNVNIGDYGNNTKDAKGNIYIETPMLVKGGTVEISGNMDNPYFKGNILVDIAENAGKFTDNRISNSGDSTSTEKEYKVHYYENFFGSGRYTAKQYTSKDTIQAEGTLYQHEGYKIVEWNTAYDKTGTSYPIGSTIASENDHSAWNDKGDTGAVILYAIWEKISYTVKYEPNATKYTGQMQDQEFKYAETEELNANNYKVAGKRFTGWNTKPDGTGTAYAADYSDSMMTKNDGETITLYAQWADCTHKGGAHPGTLSYTVDNTTHTITESCDCEGHTATVSISATSTYHDGQAHPAIRTITGEILDNTPEIVYSYKATQSGEYGSMPDGMTVPTNTGYYKATITLGSKTTFVEYEIKSPAEGVNIDASAAKGQRFEDIEDQKSLSVAKDDAFTVQFDVQNLNQGTQAYITAPILKLNEELPTGTTIIMQADDEYWYCKSPTGTSIQLADFQKMGESNTAYEYDTVNIKTAQKYRFIIDFSKVSSNNMLSNDLTLTLEYQNRNTGSENVSGTTTVSFGEKGAFNVTTNNDTLKATAPANDVYTRWENKTMLWKISSNDKDTKLPSDAKLTISTTNDGETQTSIYQQNQKGEFIIPFTWNSNKEFKLSLDSEQARLKGKTYDLKAKLFVGNDDTNNALSLPQAAESNTSAGNTTLKLKIAEDTSPAVGITGTQRILTVSKGTDTTLDLTVETKNTDSYQLKATIQQKNNEAYTGDFLAADVAEGENKFSTGGITTAGSYRLLVRVIKDNQIVMTVPYYFIVK